MSILKAKQFEALPELETSAQINYGDRFVKKSTKKLGAFIPRVRLRLKNQKQTDFPGTRQVSQEKNSSFVYDHEESVQKSESINNTIQQLRQAYNQRQSRSPQLVAKEQATIEELLKEVKFKGPTHKDITLQKFGLNENVLNRHVGAESLRSRMLPKEELPAQTLNQDGEISLAITQSSKERTMVLPAVSSVRSSNQSVKFTSFLRKVDDSTSRHNRRVETAIDCDKTPEKRASNIKYSKSDSKSLPFNNFAGLLSDDIIGAVLQPIDGID